MAKQKQLNLIRRGVNAWNKVFSTPFAEAIHLEDANLSGMYLERAWLIRANFMNADLRGCMLKSGMLLQAEFMGADLTEACLTGAKLEHARFQAAELIGADLSDADINGATFWESDLTNANLRNANLAGAYFEDANLTGADLSGANLESAHFVNTNLTGANLTNCRVHGVSAWGLNLTDTIQKNLIITTEDEPEITLDYIEIAQFIYLLLNNTNIRNVIDGISSKVVLILGRFTSDRKDVLEALKEKLRRLRYVPIIFDFDKPASRDLTATISTLAHMSRLIIADLTEPNSVPYEMAMIIPLTPVPMQPIIAHGNQEFSMFDELSSRYSWVQPIFRYHDTDNLLSHLESCIIRPTDAKRSSGLL